MSGKGSFFFKHIHTMAEQWSLWLCLKPPLATFTLCINWEKKECKPNSFIKPYVLNVNIGITCVVSKLVHSWHCYFNRIEEVQACQGKDFTSVSLVQLAEGRDFVLRYRMQWLYVILIDIFLFLLDSSDPTSKLWSVFDLPLII